MQAVRVAGIITDAGTVQRGRWQGRVWLAELTSCSAHASPHGGGRRYYHLRSSQGGAARAPRVAEAAALAGIGHEAAAQPPRRIIERASVAREAVRSP